MHPSLKDGCATTLLVIAGCALAMTGAAQKLAFVSTDPRSLRQIGEVHLLPDGNGMATVMWVFAIYLLWKADTIAARALGERWAV